MAETTTPAPATIDDLLRTFEQQISGGGSVEQPIGVPEGFQAGTTYADMPSFLGVDFSIRQPGRDPYLDGYQYTPANLPASARRDIQARLDAAGLIPKNAEYLHGVWDDVTVGAFTSLLSLANRAGFTWEQQLTVLENTDRANREEFEAPAFLRPDPAAVRTGVRELMKSMLGREPVDEELDHLTGVMEQYARQDYDVGVAQGRAEFDAGEAGTPAPSGADFDPIARMQEYLDTRYRPEVDMREGIANMQVSRENLLGNVFALDQYIGRSA